MDKKIKISCKVSDFLPVTDLVGFQGELKSLSKENYERLKNHIIRNGFTAPVFVWKDKNTNYLIDGHQRVRVIQAMIDEGFVCEKLPVVFISAESRKQAKDILMGMVSQFGRVEEQGLYEFAIDAEFTPDFMLENYDIPGLDMTKFVDGFFETEKTEPECDEDEVPKNVQTRCKTGDLWILGDHRLLCGDSTNAKHVERLMGGVCADVVFTDPPYNVGFDYNQIDDDKTPTEYLNFCRSFFDLAKANSVGSVLITPGITNFPMWIGEIEKTHYLIAWVKENQCSRNYIGKTAGFNCWEPVLVYRRSHKNIPRDVYNIPIHIQSDTGDHPCPKSIKFLNKIIEDFTDDGQSVLDLFLGSGTTLIACEKTNRKCFGMEIDAHYCDVIIERWENFSGRKAILG